MSAPATALPDLAPAPTAEGAQALLDAQMGMLAELAEIGMEVARAVGRQATEGPVLERGQDLTLAFSRASRAVRLTLMLQTRLTQPPSCAKDNGDAAVETIGEDGPPRLFSGDRRRARARELVEMVVRDEHVDEETVERLMAEAGERLEVEEDIDNKRMGQIVALICNDLQLSPRRVAAGQGVYFDDDEPSYLWGPDRPAESSAEPDPPPTLFASSASIEWPFVSPFAPPGEREAAAAACPGRKHIGQQLYPPRPFPRSDS